jgi:TolA-binding protein
MSVRQRVAGADALLRRLRRARPRFSAIPWGRAAVAAAVAAAVLVVAGLWGKVSDRISGYPTSRLSFVVDGGFLKHGSVIDVDPANEATLRFSDGSDVRLARGSHASMRQVEGSGARLSLADGSAYVDIVHRAGARWLFDAGPFLITVTGTAFRLGWDAAKEELDVRMDRGSIEVSGPLSDAALSLRSGQHLVVRVRQRETLIRERDEAAPDEPAAGQATATSVDSATAGPSMRATSSVDGGGRLRAGFDGPKQDWPGGSKQDWPQLLANGDFEAIVRQAERLGVEGCLASARSADLSALADAARYGRHDELARSALQAQRRRFSGGRASRDAAFLLGKLEETDQNPAAAIGWYDRYMREDAKGPYASDALGRKMIVVQELYGDAQARSVAAEYLSRFPDGAYVSRARTLTRTP